MATEPLLLTESLDVGYGPVVILRGVSLSIAAGESFSILGANGAGKTTFLRAVAGLGVQRRGVIRFNGQAVGTSGAGHMVDLGVSLVPEGRQLFMPLSVEENLEVGGLPLRRRGQHTVARQALESVWQLFPRLAERRRQAVGTLSGGEQQMVAIGRALAARPRLLLLDEPSVGLAPRIIEHLFAVFRQLKQSGLTIVLAEQNVLLALELADRAALLDVGQISLIGTPAELRAEDRIRRIYLGE